MYPIQMNDSEKRDKMAHQALVNPKEANRKKLVKDWHKKLFHIHAEGIFSLIEQDEGIPNFSREELRNHQCVP